MEAEHQNVTHTSERILTREGVDYVFGQNPELASIGTKEQYAQYLESFFPHSKFKGIVYHGSSASFKDEGFKPMKPNFNTLNSIEGVFNFSSDRRFTQQYGSHTYAVILDIRTPIEEETSGECIDDMDKPLSEALYKTGRLPENEFSPSYDEALKNADAVINSISGNNWSIPPQKIVSVFNQKQIHILGSSFDIQKFREFVEGVTSTNPNTLPS